MFRIKVNYEKDIITKDYVKILNKVEGVLNNMAFVDNFTLVAEIKEEDLKSASMCLKLFMGLTCNYTPIEGKILNVNNIEIYSTNILER